MFNSNIFIKPSNIVMTDYLSTRLYSEGILICIYSAFINLSLKKKIVAFLESHSKLQRIWRSINFKSHGILSKMWNMRLANQRSMESSTWNRMERLVEGEETSVWSRRHLHQRTIKRYIAKFNGWESNF